MRALICGVKASNYDFKDQQTGRQLSGVSTEIWGFKLKPEAKDGSVGFKSFSYKASDAKVAQLMQSELVKAQEPLLCEIELDETGSRDKSLVVSDITIKARLSQVQINLTGASLPEAAKK